MDPNATYEIMKNSDNKQERIEAARDLLKWINGGGFIPKEMTFNQILKESRDVFFGRA